MLRTYLFLFIVIFLFSCELPSQTTDRPLKNSLLHESGPEIERGKHGSYNYLTGIVKNNGNSEVSLVKIEFALCDNSGNKIGTAWDSISNLMPHQSWKYRALVTVTESCHVCGQEISAF